MTLIFELEGSPWNSLTSSMKAFIVPSVMWVPSGSAMDRPFASDWNTLSMGLDVWIHAAVPSLEP